MIKYPKSQNDYLDPTNLNLTIPKRLNGSYLVKTNSPVLFLRSDKSFFEIDLFGNALLHSAINPDRTTLQFALALLRNSDYSDLTVEQSFTSLNIVTELGRVCVETCLKISAKNLDLFVSDCDNSEFVVLDLTNEQEVTDFDFKILTQSFKVLP